MNLDNLKGHIPDPVLAEIPGIIDMFQVNTPERMAHLLGQIDQETLFRPIRENLNYSESGLLSIFRGYFTTDPNDKVKRLASYYAHKPEDIANYVYANRNGNRNEASGDGWLYRGAPFLGLTGRGNFQEFANAIGDQEIMANPDKICTNYALSSAAWFFKRWGLFKIADEGVNNDTVQNVTRHVNGRAMIGLQNRIAFTNQFYKLLK